jgi:integrase
MARDIKYIAYSICDRAHGLKVLPMNVANPAGKSLDVLLGQRQRKGGHWYAIPYEKVPALYAKLDELSKPAYNYFTVREAARATGVTPSTINLDIIEGRLPATKGECLFKNLIGWEWHIEPADLFKLRKKVVDLIPGVRPVAMHLVKFAALNGCRPSEAREMRWPEYDPVERLWIIPWQRTKEGEDIRQDMVIPLSQDAIDILDIMKAQQERDQIKTDYVFASYLSRFNKMGRQNWRASLHPNIGQ